ATPLAAEPRHRPGSDPRGLEHCVDPEPPPAPRAGEPGDAESPPPELRPPNPGGVRVWHWGLSCIPPGRIRNPRLHAARPARPEPLRPAPTRRAPNKGKPKSSNSWAPTRARTRKY